MHEENISLTELSYKMSINNCINCIFICMLVLSIVFILQHVLHSWPTTVNDLWSKKKNLF
jgi:hypothetical protein